MRAFCSAFRAILVEIAFGWASVVPPVVVPVVVLIAVYAGELVWSERDVRMAAIADTAPVATWVPLAGKFLALLGMLVVLQATFLMAGVLLQTVRGYHVFELGLYARAAPRGARRAFAAGY